MVCFRCGLKGHNVRSIEKCIAENFDKMHTLVTTGYFYTHALNNLFFKNRGKICMINNAGLRWKTNTDFIENIYILYDELVERKCKKTFVFFPLMITSKQGNHANGLLINHVSKTIIRIEPHGGFFDLYTKVENVIRDSIRFSNYTLIPIKQSCPRRGIQTRFDDKYGLCQVATIYYLDAIINNNKNMLKARRSEETKYRLFSYLVNILKEHTITVESLFNEYEKHRYSKLMLRYNEINRQEKDYVQKFFPHFFFRLGL